MIGPTLVRAHDRLGGIGAMRVVPGFAAPAFAGVATRPEDTRPAKRPRLEADRRRDMLERVRDKPATLYGSIRLHRAVQHAPPWRAGRTAAG